MRFNVTTQYAIRIFEQMIKESDRTKHNAKEIAQTLEIPYKYMTKIMTMLVEAKLITSTRGRDGGYQFAKNPKDIKLQDILEAVNDMPNTEECVLGGKCKAEGEECILHERCKAPRKMHHELYEESVELLSQL
jgi:Rrf2 family protein